MKSDLTEFKTTMTSDATLFLNQTSANLVQKTTSGTLFGIGDTKVSNKEQTNPKNKNGKTSSESITSFSLQSRYHEELRSIQSSENTYLPDPKIESSNEFLEWQANFNADLFKANISDLLIENSSLRVLYSKMVINIPLHDIQFSYG